MGVLVFLGTFLIVMFLTGSAFAGLFCAIFLTAFAGVFSLVSSHKPDVANKPAVQSQTQDTEDSEVGDDDDFLIDMMHRQLRRRVHGNFGSMTRNSFNGFGRL